MAKKAGSSKKTRSASKESSVLDAKFKPVSGTIFRKTEGTEVLVVNFNQPDKFYRMDAWAAALWQTFDGKLTLKKACLKIQKKSGLKLDFVEREAVALVQQLLKVRLLETPKKIS